MNNLLNYCYLIWKYKYNYLNPTFIITYTNRKVIHVDNITERFKL